MDYNNKEEKFQNIINNIDNNKEQFFPNESKKLFEEYVDVVKILKNNINSIKENLKKNK
jgi:hypothetical protein